MQLHRCTFVASQRRAAASTASAALGCIERTIQARSQETERRSYGENNWEFSMNSCIYVGDAVNYDSQLCFKSLKNQFILIPHIKHELSSKNTDWIANIRSRKKYKCILAQYLLMLSSYYSYNCSKTPFGTNTKWIDFSPDFLWMINQTKHVISTFAIVNQTNFSLSFENRYDIKTWIEVNEITWEIMRKSCDIITNVSG